jgi:uncharacterized protein (DUF433 family)
MSSMSVERVSLDANLLFASLCCSSSVQSGCSDILRVMSPAAAAESIPLSADSQGVLRVAGTRVTLDTVVEVYKAGSTPEEIARHYPSLQLADVYAVLTHYLRHQEEVEAYLRQRQEEAAAVRREAEARVDRRGLRERLLARLAG